MFPEKPYARGIIYTVRLKTINEIMEFAEVRQFYQQYYEIHHSSDVTGGVLSIEKFFFQNAEKEYHVWYHSGNDGRFIFKEVDGIQLFYDEWFKKIGFIEKLNSEMFMI